VRTRIIAGAIAIPIFVIPIWLGGIFVLLLGLTVTILAVMEFYFMADAGGYKPIRLIGVPMAIVLFLSGWNPDDVQRSATTITGVLQAPTRLIVEWVSYPTVTVLTLGLIFMLIYALFVHDHPLSSFMSTAMGAIYIGVLMSQIVALRFWDNGLWYVLWGLLVTWANDTFAAGIGDLPGEAVVGREVCLLRNSGLAVGVSGAPPGVRRASPPFRPAQTPGYVAGQTLPGWAHAPAATTSQSLVTAACRPLSVFLRVIRAIRDSDRQRLHQ
jgi:hypothetical protein